MTYYYRPAIHDYDICQDCHRRHTPSPILRYFIMRFFLITLATGPSSRIENVKISNFPRSFQMTLTAHFQYTLSLPLCLMSTPTTRHFDDA